MSSDRPILRSARTVTSETGCGPGAFFAATAQSAKDVLAASEPWQAYEAAVAFRCLASSVICPEAVGTYLDAEPLALYLIWKSLTGEMERSGSDATDATAVGRMQRAAEEWLAVLDVPEARREYCERWTHVECGYPRRSHRSDVGPHLTS